MEKFDVEFRQERVAYFCIEAHNSKEAEQLFADKMLNDDGFVDKVYEVLENGTVDEDIFARPCMYDGRVDYTYEQMKEREG